MLIWFKRASVRALEISNQDGRFKFHFRKKMGISSVFTAELRDILGAAEMIKMLPNLPHDNK